MLKIKAYTLMEVTIAMLISAICVTICYTAYGLIDDYYHVFIKKNEKVAQFMSLRKVMQTDFLKCNHIIKSEDGLILLQDSVFIHYHFGENGISRKLGEAHTDTFALNSAHLETYFEQQVSFETDTIDQVKFTVFFDKKTPVSMQFDKHYSAKDLFK